MNIEALQHLIYEYAGPWTFRQAIEAAHESTFELDWDMPITNWSDTLTGSWDLLIHVKTDWCAQGITDVQLLIQVEDRERRGNSMIEYTYWFDTMEVH